MKTRNGFVSNSSTSSFCIYGTTVDRSEFLKNLTDEAKAALDLEPKVEDEEDEDGEDWYTATEGIETKSFVAKTGISLEIYSPEYYDQVYVGRSLTDIGDDETGAQFKARVQTDVAKLLKLKGLKFSYEAEAWRDG